MPKSETEKALKDSLRDLEIQCKERVDLLEALRESRKEQAAGQENGSASSTEESNGKIVKSSKYSRKDSDSEAGPSERGYIGNGTIPAVTYPALSRPPPLPQRPAMMTKNSSEQAVVGSRAHAVLSMSSPPAIAGPRASSSTPTYQPMLAPPMKKTSRSPSPEKRTMLHTLRSGDKTRRTSRPKTSKKEDNTVTNRAATLAWQATSRTGERDRLGRYLESDSGHSASMLPDARRTSLDNAARPNSASNVRYDSKTRRLVPDPVPTPPEVYATNPYLAASGSGGYPFPTATNAAQYPPPSNLDPFSQLDEYEVESPAIEEPARRKRTPPPVPPHGKSSSSKLDPLPYPTYLKEYPDTTAKKASASTDIPIRRKAASAEGGSANISKLGRKPVSTANMSSPRRERPSERDPARRAARKSSKAPHEDTGVLDADDDTYSSEANNTRPKRRTRPKQKQKEEPLLADPVTPDSDAETTEETAVEDAWKAKVAALMKNLPKGVDEGAAKQIFNEIVVQGDEVHWEDVAGLEIAKKALKEAVVYPFLRPDLFMGLREPARGMLLFGPPGTGKTMLARAVATESRSTFFSISASSLTSKYLGESEKLVRALFSLAKALAPSIIFVDEIDSLLSSRSGSGEHEATRRIKTEFLIQWSDLQRAAAGREQSDKEKERGDASRVLVLAATNLPWAIDEAARRRFVRRQYIPLPEDFTRATQLRTLLSHQKHALEEADIDKLVQLTDGVSFHKLLNSCLHRCRTNAN